MNGVHWVVGVAIVLLLLVVGYVGLRGRGGAPREGFRFPAEGDHPKSPHGGASPYIVMRHGGKAPPAEKTPQVDITAGGASPCHCPPATGKRRFDCEETQPLCWNGKKYSTKHGARAQRARAYCAGSDSYCNTIDDSDSECRSCGQDTSGDHPTFSSACKCPTSAGDARFKCHDPNPYCWNGVKFRRKYEAQAQKEWDYCGGADAYCSSISRHDKACASCGGTAQAAALPNVPD
jgi:hypothetical protein